MNIQFIMILVNLKIIHIQGKKILTWSATLSNFQNRWGESDFFQTKPTQHPCYMIKVMRNSSFYWALTIPQNCSSHIHSKKSFLWPDIFLMEKDFFTQKFQRQISLKLSNLVNYLRRGEVYISLKH